MSRGFRRVLPALIAAALLIATMLVTAGPVAAGGNSANAKLCQKNGWTSFYRSDGTAFADQDACVSYGARGGTYQNPFEKACSDLGSAVFPYRPAGDPTVSLTCEDAPYAVSTFVSLINACQATAEAYRVGWDWVDRGSTRPGDYVNIACYLFFA